MFGQTVAQICFGLYSRLPIVVEPKEVSVSSDAGILPDPLSDRQGSRETNWDFTGMVRFYLEHADIRSTLVSPDFAPDSRITK